MATITTYKRPRGTRYTAQIRIRRGGKIVYQETKTFDRRRLASDWATRRELELQEPGALAQVQQRGVTIGTLLARYLAEMGEGWGRSKRFDIAKLQHWPLADLDALQLTSAQLIEHAQQRRAGGAGPATTGNDLIWLRQVFKTARVAWGVPVDLQVLDDAAHWLRGHRVIGKSQQRDRRPTADEVERLRDYFGRRDARSAIPMTDIMDFAVYSARRQAEITGLRWADLDRGDSTVLVRDMKSPKGSAGNHRRARLLSDAMAVIERQAETDERIFPYESRSIGAAWARACKVLGIDDLHFHDLRHEATSRLFERGYTIQEVQQITLHDSWATLQRYVQLRPGDLQER